LADAAVPEHTPDGAWDPWGPVLDDLDGRVTAAESGDLAALDGWEPPAVQPEPMTPDAQRRANGILTRQRTLLARLRDEQRAVAGSMRAMRRPQFRPVTAPPVYVDRIG
jgi:hypothetical protein